MIEEALIYTTGVIIIVLILKSYLIRSAQLDSETQIAKANAYANAQKAGYMAETGALNFGNDSHGSLDSIEGIMSLLQNPVVQGLLEKMKKKE